MGYVNQSLPGKLLYGFLFIAVVPALLVLWACATSGTIAAPAVFAPRLGLAAMAAGLLLLLIGMLALWRVGGGLPMNAFPPPRFVAKGVYAVLPHPIYGGFITACIGASLYFGSASGLWLISPTVALYCAALVLGYEMPDLRQRFGKPAFSLWLPADKSGSATLLERLRIYLVILLPWLVIFEAIGALGRAPDAVSTYLPLERALPLWEPMELFYGSTYLVVLLAPLLVRSGTALRQLALQALRAMALLFPLYLLLPFYVPPRRFAAASIFAPLLAWERTPISGIGAFPSFHVVWALIAACALGYGGRARKILWTLWALLVCASCVATGMHSILDVLAGAAAYFAVARMDEIWKQLLRITERFANSWREWRIGSLRIINHGAYAGLGTFAGICIINSLLGAGHRILPVAIFVLSTIGAALWAQWVEGSPALLRPMGFYGGMIGAVLGALLAPLLGVSLWSVCAALAIAAPWIQALGRLRCLVQGCCHGHATGSVPGIRYHHPRTRVYRLAHLAGIPIHATPVYSIFCNVVVGLALLRLLQLGCSCSFLCGIYLLLTSAGRFVEEAYRGEPQTKVLHGLRFYQWIAIFTGIAGAALTCIPSAPLQRFAPLHAGDIALALACGLGSWFATGMDFPESSRRFARLT